MTFVHSKMTNEQSSYMYKYIYMCFSACRLYMCLQVNIEHMSYSLLTLSRCFGEGGTRSRIHVIASVAGRLKYGGCPSNISITIIPRDQISTCIMKHMQSWQLYDTKYHTYLSSIRLFGYDLRSHPIWCPNKRDPFLML